MAKRCRRTSICYGKHGSIDGAAVNATVYVCHHNAYINVRVPQHIWHYALRHSGANALLQGQMAVVCSMSIASRAASKGRRQHAAVD